MLNNKKIDKIKVITCHMNAAEHHQKSVNYHFEAAKLHQAGEYDKATSAAYLADAHVICAIDHAKEAAQHCAGIVCKDKALVD